MLRIPCIPLNTSTRNSRPWTSSMTYPPSTPSTFSRVPYVLVLCNTAHAATYPNESEDRPPQGQCPSCGDWHCRYEMDWCSGNVASAISNPVGCPSQSSGETSHPLKPGPCMECIRGDAAEPWFLCANTMKDDCLTWQTSRYDWVRGTSRQHCSHCASVHSTLCRCGETWFCGACTKKGRTHGLATCSRCHKTVLRRVLQICQFEGPGIVQGLRRRGR
ncbi:hypothetical protein F5I97DRAFT_12837 [Phlebopus sp. FC_14]|nr:hypothetical protein F5I97DRAFT_12837 [Phlebopus sp. FC_14]